ncbi:DinB family protein [Shouchella shacheensis]|uniref:DinB family protein n=1 Tax=Shouchella shacheensis TaxID=1649580 RepID=UPI00074028D2|nr:DinB family protein [Shouchella shacheensis]
MKVESLIDNIKFQFSISKQLLDYHLTSLEQEEYMWKSPKSGLFLKEFEGEWFADLPETESYDLGTPSVAWTLWHITFWWEMVFDNAFGEGKVKKEDIKVTTDVAEIKRQINSLAERWESKLNQLTSEDYQSKKYSKFPFNNEVEFHKLASWLNLELIKNASEVGYARFDYAKR